MRWLRGLAVVSSLVTACGGASEQDVLSASSTSSTSSSGGSGTSSSSGSTSGTGGSVTSDAGTPNDPAGKCPQESEPNDDRESANKLASSLCGALSPSSEADYLTFELPPGTKSMSLTYDGNIKMKVSVDGKDTVEISPESNPPIPFVVGKPYMIEIRAFSGSDKVTWRVNLNRS